MLFGTTATGWTPYQEDILAFCKLMQYTPSKEAREFLLQAQRGYPRISLVKASDGWVALAAVQLWNLCCWPFRLQLVVCGTTKQGVGWIKFLYSIAAGCLTQVRQNCEFSEDRHTIFGKGSDELSISVMTPILMSGIKTQLVPGRRTIVVIPDFDRVPTPWMSTIKSLTSGPRDQWITVVPKK